MHARAAIVLLLFCCATVRGHQTTDSYLAFILTNRLIEARWAISLRDLDHVLTIDSNKDGEASDEELSSAKPRIQKYAFDHLKIETDGGRVQPHVTSLDVEEHSDAVYVASVFDFPLPDATQSITLTYTLFNDTDPLHRGLFRFDLPETTQTAIFSPAQPTQRFHLNLPQKRLRFANFLREGIWHIWTGYDHVLFLIALLLPSVLVRTKDNWQPAPRVREAVIAIVKVVTAFTLAHSITLTVASLHWFQLPSRFVESTIAASVFLAAINNLKPIFPERTWLIAFTFGLIHGFGFASALSELHLTSSSLAATLVGFNLGVELGQLAIVLTFVPIAWTLRRTKLYQQFILRFGSITIAVLAAAWFVERLTDRRILPF